jgi:acyl-CoA reductase-like NAD-dependent aldehyde dehydrogenase
MPAGITGGILLCASRFHCTGRLSGRYLMTVTVKNLIDGQWVDSVSGRTLESINPANTSEVVGVVSRSEQADVDHAVASARRAFEGWRLTPAPKRGEIIFKAAATLMKRKKELG